ncbi:hypothetical protein GE09DRAFT_1109664 [Coniochaeta sp. 2T2.1]|nr:hypothetical protein GE09DRAFT_1109664 [Coniochaeta sp. 2T2.1]
MIDGPFPKTPDEEAFLQQIASDASLAEISIALGMRHWSPDASVQRKAVVHASNAASLIIQRIKTDTAHEAAVLGAVLSMAIGERLLNNVPVWNIHIDGLAKMITERRVHGTPDLPQLVTAFMIIDSTNYVFDYPLGYHQKVIDAIRPYGHRPLADVSAISEDLIQFRKLVDIHRKFPHSSYRVQQILQDRDSLLRRVRALRSEDDQYIQVTALAMELTLYLTWSPLPDSTLNLTPVAGRLWEAMNNLPVRPCMFMDLASCPLMLGAVAADEGSEVRDWFVTRIRKAVETLKSRGWRRPLEVLERAFTPDDGLVSRFRALWREIDS